MGKILFVDVDGTLCSPVKNEPPESAKQAIRQARENGHRVYICTGRSLAEIYPDILEIGLDGIIGGNGCYVEHEGKIIYHKVLSLEQCTRVVDWCKQNNHEFYLECNSGLYPSEGYRQCVADRYRKQYGKEISYGKFFDEMIYHQSPYRDDVNKISFMLDNWQDYLDAQKEFEDMFVGFWGGEAGKATYGDTSPKGVNKLAAIEFLLEYLHEDKANTISFGDASVDLPMFEITGYSVAMGDGEEVARKAADYVTAATDDDGLAKAFEYLKLI